MPLVFPQPITRRSALRRAVDLECDVRSPLWDGAVPFHVADLSPYGLWLDSELPMDAGEELVVSLRPPRWPVAASPLVARGRVARVGLPRRRGDHQPAGMGLRFLDLEEAERDRLQSVLVGLPPPIPRDLAPRRPRMCDPETAFEIGGHSLSLEAEAPLLTSRPRRTRRTRITQIVRPLPLPSARPDVPHLRLVVG